MFIALLGPPNWAPLKQTSPRALFKVFLYFVRLEDLDFPGVSPHFVL